MKKLVLSTLVAGLVASTVATADTITILTGSETGNYHKVIGKSMKKQLEKKGHKVYLQTSKGSVQNTQSVVGKKNVIGIAQADVARGLIDGESDTYGDVGMNGNLGYECLFTVVRADGVDEWSEITGKMASGKNGSGTLYTVEKLLEMNPVAGAKIQKKQGKRYIGKVENKSYGAYAFMSIPDPKNAKIKNVMGNKNVDFLPMHELELGELGAGDNPVYTKISVPTEKTFFTGKTKNTLDAICTHATLVVDEEATSEKVLDDIYEASQQVKTKSQTAYGFASSWINKAKTGIKKAQENFK